MKREGIGPPVPRQPRKEKEHRSFGEAVVYVLLILLVAGAAYGAWWWYGKIDLPVERELTHRDGRTIEVVIVGRSETDLRFHGAGDERLYDVRIEDLSEADRRFLRRVPVSELEPLPSPAESRPYVVSRREEIARLQAEIAELRAELRSGDLSESFLRDYRARIDRYEGEIAEMEEVIDLPVERELTHRDGRTIEVVIVGRSETDLRFHGAGDERLYDVRIEDLSEADRRFLRRVPVSELEPLPSPAESRPYVLSRREEIARLQGEIAELRVELRSGDLSESFVKDYRARIDRYKEEIAEMEEAIERFLAENQ